MFNKRTAKILSIIIVAQFCCMSCAVTGVQAASWEQQDQIFEDSSEGNASFEDDSISGELSTEDPAADEFSGEDIFKDSGEDAFSAGEDDWQQENTQELVLNAQDGEDITEKLNALLIEARDKASDGNPCKVTILPGSYSITGTICTYSNIHLYATGAVITKTSPRKELLLRLGDTEKSAGGYDGYRNVTIEGGVWDSNYDSVENKEADGGFVGFRLGHATNVVIKNVTFLNNLKSHFLELAGVKNAEIIGCTFSGYWKEYDGGGQECIQLDACMPRIFPEYTPYDGSVCENIVIKDNTFNDVFAGIGSHSMMFDRPYRNITISDNLFTNVKKRAIWCLNYQDTTVSGNIMENVGGGIYVRSIYTRNTHTLPGQGISSQGNQNSVNDLIANNQITLASYTTLHDKTWSGYGIWISGEVSEGSAGETIPSEDDDPENTGSSVTDGVPAGRYIIRGVTVRNNAISGNSDGIKLTQAEDCICRSNKITLSESSVISNMGIRMYECSNIKLLYNKLSGGRGYGIYARDAAVSRKGSAFFRNTISGFGKGGIQVTGIPAGSRVERNRIRDNAQDGINVNAVNSITLDGNYVYRNGKNAIWLQNCPSANIIDNFASSSGMNGIEVIEKSDSINISGNIIGASQKNGMCLTNIFEAAVNENVFLNNKEYAVRLKGSRVCSYNKNSFAENGHSDRIYSRKSQMPETE